MGPVGDLGPNWFWKLIFMLAAFGLIVGLAAIVKGIIWLCHHVSIN